MSGSDYERKFVHNGLKNYHLPNCGIGAVVTEDSPLSLTITKGDDFEPWITCDIEADLNDGVRKPAGEVYRAYLHYLLDCWLDGAPVSKNLKDMV